MKVFSVLFASLTLLFGPILVGLYRDELAQIMGTPTVPFIDHLPLLLSFGVLLNLTIIPFIFTSFRPSPKVSGAVGGICMMVGGYTQGSWGGALLGFVVGAYFAYFLVMGIHTRVVDDDA